MSKPVLTSDWHRINGKYSCQFKMHEEARLEVVWSPTLPPPKVIAKIVKGSRYFVARHKFLGALSQSIGRALVVLDA